MARYVALVNWTDQGVKNANQTVERAAAARQGFEKVGARITEILWCLGQYDMVLLAEAPDDETMTAAALATSKLGNVRTLTLRAFGEKEMQGIVKRAGT